MWERVARSWHPLHGVVPVVVVAAAAAAGGVVVVVVVVVVEEDEVVVEDVEDVEVVEVVEAVVVVSGTRTLGNIAKKPTEGTARRQSINMCFSLRIYGSLCF